MTLAIVKDFLVDKLTNTHRQTDRAKPYASDLSMQKKAKMLVHRIMQSKNINMEDYNNVHISYEKQIL